MDQSHAQFRENGDVEIAYLDQGEGEPILLIHGFASNEGDELGSIAWSRR